MFRARRAHHQERQIALIQFLVTVLIQCVSPDDEHDMQKTCREL